MGTCLSSQKQDDIVPQPVKVAQVSNESVSMDLKEYFSPLEKIAKDEWQLDSVYFVLPSTKLHNQNPALQSRKQKQPRSRKRHGGSRVMAMDGRQLHKTQYNHLTYPGLLKSQILAEESTRITPTQRRYKWWWRATLSPIPEHFAY